MDVNMTSKRQHGKSTSNALQLSRIHAARVVDGRSDESGTANVCRHQHALISWQCCGPAKHLLPELLQLRCSTSAQSNRDLTRLDSDINQLLKAMNFEGSLFWQPSKHQLAQQHEITFLTINVLPRFADSASLTQIIFYFV